MSLGKRFGGAQVVSQVSLVVKEGEIAGLIGPNGAGKTTLFNLVAGGLQPSSGRIQFRGEMLHLPPGQDISIYSLAAVLPLLPAKQRVSDANDWMTTDAEVACPDPNCPSRLRITRLAPRQFQRSQSTAVQPGQERKR